MHLVKSAASNQRQNPASLPTAAEGTANATPQSTGVPETFASGTGNDPLAGLTGARYAGFAGLPSADMFQNPPSGEDMIRQLSDPNFAQMMRESLNNPQVIDMMINQSPQLRAMGPQARQILQSDHFRQMMTNPDMLRQMMQMQSMMGGGGGGLGGMGGMGGGTEAFPAPGVTNTTDQPENQQNNTQNAQNQQQTNPFAALGGPGGFGGGMGGGMDMNQLASMLTQMNPNQAGQTQTLRTQPSGTTESGQNPSQQQQQPANPFAALFNPAMFGGQQPGPGNADPAANNTGSAPANPFMNNPLLQNPEAMRNMMQMMGGGGGVGGGMFGGPPDNRPPEQRYETQLRQLNEMGFHDFDRNIQALSRSGGDVNGALEWLFSQPS